MAPSTAAIIALLRQTVYYHLDNFSYDNALFFAEKLYVQDARSHESSHLLALCYFRLQDYRTAYEVAKTHALRGTSLGCSWIFSQACLQIERYKDGITSLEKSMLLWSHRNSLGQHNASTRAPLPDSAAVYCLLGKLYRAYGDRKKALVCFEDALKANPLLWDAFTAICEMGVSIRIPNIFKTSDTMLRSFDLDIAITSHDSRLNTVASSADPSSRRPPNSNTSRTPVLDSHDPFEPPRLQRPPGQPSHDPFATDPTDLSTTHPPPGSTRSRTGGPGQNGSLEPSLSNPDSQASSQEGPSHVNRRTRGQITTDPFMEPTSMRMNYHITTRRTARAHDPNSLDTTYDTPSASSMPHPPLTRSAAAAATYSTNPFTSSISDRKRTLSGHPVRSQANFGDNASNNNNNNHNHNASQRRSNRINTLRPTSTRTVTGATNSTLSATTTTSRELKKAKAPISRLARPGATSTIGRVVSGNRKPLDSGDGMDTDTNEAHRATNNTAASQPNLANLPTSSSATSENGLHKIGEAMRWILDLLKKFATAYHHLTQYQCSEAIQALLSLPKAHQESPWVLSLMGRAHYEQSSYAEAEQFYNRLRVLMPTRIQDMEMYSTTLWFLRREAELTFLARELIDLNWHAPQAWCALGNAWSLAHDHEQALKCFKRATQLNPKFAYAFTLQGHELVDNEEYDKALTTYRLALSSDPRHYNAYYGIGLVYQKLENYEKAYAHFHTASIINPTNAVLICCIGTVLEKQKQIGAALQYFSKAVDIAPKAPETRFRKARALLALGHIEAAQRELMILKDLAPDMATVHFFLGKLYQSMNEKQSAVRHFSTALALDPKASAQIKRAIEAFEGEEMNVDESMM